MKILVVGQYKHEIYERSLFDAFINMGHEVSSFQIGSFDYVGNNRFLSIVERFQNRYLLGPKIIKINSRLLHKVNSVRPDLVFLYRVVEINPTIIAKIKNLGCEVFSYNNDDPFSRIPSKRYWRNYFRTTLICDHNFVYRKKNIEDFNNIGINNVSLLMPYYIKENNFPITIDKTFDVIFAGHFENDGRDKYIKALLDAKINVNVFGDPKWKEAPLYQEIKSVFNTAKRGKDYNILLNKAKIALVFLSKINSDTYTRRCFEIPATKTLMLSEYTTDLDNLYKHNKEAVYFRSEEDLVVKCKNLISNPSKIKQIGEAGFKRLHSDDHSIENRARKILEYYTKKNKK